MKSWIANLPLARKFLLLGILAVLVTTVPATLQLRTVQQQLAAAQLELSGIEPSRALMRVVQLTQQHRGLSAVVLGGDAALESARAAKHKEVEEALAAYDTLTASMDNDRLREQARRTAATWRELAQAVAARGLGGPDSGARHTALIAEQIDLHERLTDHFALTMHPAAAGYFLIIATLQNSPRMIEALGQTRAVGALVLSRKEATAEQKTRLAALSDRAQAQLRDVGVNLSKAFDADPALKSSVGPAVEQARAQADAVIALARKEILEAASLTYTPAEFFNVTTAAIDSAYVAVAQAGKALEAALAHEAARAKRMAAISLALIAALLGTATLLGVWIARSVISAAAQAQAVAERIAAGDLTGEVDSSSTDEMGRMLAAMRDMQSSLVKVVGQVRGNAESVATASAQIAQGNSDLSQRTEEQASALEETAATMNQLGSTVKNNADNARQANQLALSASEVAQQGGAVVGEVVETMKGINESSRKIAEIIGTIDGIAFQTNILALNAAVEAARAGEQGRGFAVVASEVRSLAQRSAEAAREIKALIGASVERVEQGSALVDKAGTTMGEVVASIKRVTDIVGEISSASGEQATGVNQVGEAITQMDQVTQQNAALVEESAAAAESLKGQAQQLVSAVAVFKLAHGAGGATVAASGPATTAAWSGTERRGPDRAKNVSRAAFGQKAKAEAPKTEAPSSAAQAKTGTDDWTSF